VGLEWGSLSLVSTIEELLGRNSSSSDLESWEYGRRDPSRWPLGSLCPQKLALSSPTSGHRLVCILRLRTQATDFSLVFGVYTYMNTSKVACSSLSVRLLSLSISQCTLCPKNYALVFRGSAFKCTKGITLCVVTVQSSSHTVPRVTTSDHFQSQSFLTTGKPQLTNIMYSLNCVWIFISWIPPCPPMRRILKFVKLF
jgi:hypothetical protein